MRDCLDALIIGGGPAGSTAATSLAQAGWNVALVEQNAFPRRKVCGEFLSLANWPILQQLGINESVQACAGPEVTHLAVFSGARVIRAELPASFGKVGNRGRALTRDRLDGLLLNRAKESGAEILQPWKLLALEKIDGGYACKLQSRDTQEIITRQARVIVAANGSWEASPLDTIPRKAPKGSDLFGFKAHFRNASLGDGLMPLLSFENGYGGMVECQDGLTSLSCCITRAQLEKLRHAAQLNSASQTAGDQVLEHIKRSCPAILPVLRHAELQGAWLAAGPLQPGIRPRYARGIFFIGNAAGEAHPVIAEGISIAIQSAALMCKRLAPVLNDISDRSAVDAVGRAYSADWRRAFATRLFASACIAHFAMRPRWVQAACPIFARWPRVLKWCAELSGKGSPAPARGETFRKATS